MEHGNRTKKEIFVILLVIGIILILTIAVIIRKTTSDGVSFDDNEKAFFQYFSYFNSNSEEYKVKNLDAYYYDNGTPLGIYFFRVQYSCCYEEENKWYDIDEVIYGSKGKIENSYCLSWDSLNGFEEKNKEFQQAVKNGVHKSYDVSKFQEYLDKYKDED